MTQEQAASSKQHDEAAQAASSEAEAEVVDAEVIDAEVVEEDVPGDGVHDAAADADAEADPLTDALRERDEYLALAQRARADFENYRRRVASQTAEAEQRGRATLARNLLPAIDNLQRALAAAGVDPANAGDADGLGKGVALVYGELLGALERDGVVSFDPTGEAFDPNMHEAITTAPAEGVDAGTVLETLELGYRVDKQVIRPARVVVSG
jgi:molecular chaperone GrpE